MLVTRNLNDALKAIVKRKKRASLKDYRQTNSGVIYAKDCRFMYSERLKKAQQATERKIKGEAKKKIDLKRTQLEQEVDETAENIDMNMDMEEAMEEAWEMAQNLNLDIEQKKEWKEEQAERVQYISPYSSVS